MIDYDAELLRNPEDEYGDYETVADYWQARQAAELDRAVDMLDREDYQ